MTGKLTSEAAQRAAQRIDKNFRTYLESVKQPAPNTPDTVTAISAIIVSELSVAASAEVSERPGHSFDCEINNGLEKPCTCGFEAASAEVSGLEAILPDSLNRPMSERIKGLLERADREAKLAVDLRAEVSETRQLLGRAVLELSYCHAAEVLSLVRTSEGESIVEEGMKLLGLKDLSEESMAAWLEEAAQIAENPYCDGVGTFVSDQPFVVGKKIAAAIRRLSGVAQEEKS